MAALAGPLVITGPTAGADTSGFITPSGNIACGIVTAVDVPYVRCDLRERTFTPPPAPPIHSEYCYMGPWAKSVRLARGDRARFYCISDTVFADSLPVLPYGAQTTAAGLVCTSRADGVTCTDLTTGHGFRLARDSYEFF